MKSSEALELLKNAPIGDTPSKVNPSLSKTQCVDIIQKGIIARMDKYGDCELNDLYEKRVWQAVKNQRRPRY